MRDILRDIVRDILRDILRDTAIQGSVSHTHGFNADTGRT